MNTPPNARDKAEGLPSELDALESRLTGLRPQGTGTPLPDVVRRRVRSSRWSRRIRLGGASAFVVILVGLGPSLVGSLTGPGDASSGPEGREIALVALPIGEPPRSEPGLSRLTVALGRDPELLWTILDGAESQRARDGFSEPAPGADDSKTWPAPDQPEGSKPPA